MRFAGGACATALLLAVLASTGCSGAPPEVEPEAQQATVPNVVGLTESGACSVIEREGFAVGEITTQSAEADGDPKVTGQEPAAGAQADAGSKIGLVVAVPEAMTEATVPDLAGGKTS